MSRFEKGDRVVVTEGDFKGRQGTITDKDLIGDGITVALVEDGRQIETHEAHVAKAEGDRVDVETGSRIIVTRGRFKGEVGIVVDTDVIGDGIDVRLDDGDTIRTEEAHVAPFRDR